MAQRLDRRRALTTLGAAGIGGLLAACGGDDDDTSSADATTSTTTTTAAAATDSGAGDLAGRFEDASSCSLTPEETEGPYYLDLDLVRSDIREGQEGMALTLGVRVLDAACQPIPGAVVDVWHCNALGIYSGYGQASRGFRKAQTDDETYLRGTQLTDAAGIVEFTTVYPGWYRGRTVHIHSKVHLSNSEVLTTQFYFDETVTETVFASEPYASDTGRDTFNDDDGLFLEDTVLALSQEGDGYLGLINVTVEAGDGA